MTAIDVRLNTLMDCKRLVLQPVVQFRDAQERIRRRVKDDLKNCVDDYEEMLHTTLPRIRRTYEKRCEEHEFFRHQQRAIEEQRQLLSASSLAAPNDPRMQENASEIRGLTDGALPPIPGTEPSASTVNASTNRSFLETLRKKEGWDHAPRRLNALFSRMLDVSDRVPGGELSPTFATSSLAGTGAVEALPGSSDTLLPPGMSNKALQALAVKQAKAKREMEESDKAYRKAIFDLETLRLRRNKALEAAVKSLLEWRRDLTVTMQNASLQHVQLTKAMRTSIESVHQQDEQLALRMLQDLDEEQRICEEWLPNTRTLVKNERVKYVNYFHGPFNDLIFGTGLVDYAFSHGDHNVPSTVTDKGQIVPSVRPPLIVTKCIDFIEQPRCVQTPGIYRLSAKHSRVQALTSMIEQDESSFLFDTDREDPIIVASVLKLYLRQLPEPVMAMKWEERIKYTHEREEHIRTGFANFKSRIRRMPPIHQATLRALLLHLSFVAAHAATNKMTLSNLAVVFSPVILSETDHETTSIAVASEEDRTLEDLIKYCGEIFAVPTAYANPLPPVPSTPPKEPAPEASESKQPSLLRSTSLKKSLGDHKDSELGRTEGVWNP